MKYSFAGTILTPDSIEAARQWFHDNAMAIADETERFSHGHPVYDTRRKGKANWWRQQAIAALTTGKPGGQRVSVAFLQRAHFIQTGESVALLP